LWVTVLHRVIALFSFVWVISGLDRQFRWVILSNDHGKNRLGRALHSHSCRERGRDMNGAPDCFFVGSRRTGNGKSGMPGFFAALRMTSKSNSRSLRDNKQKRQRQRRKQILRLWRRMTNKGTLAVAMAYVSRRGFRYTDICVVEMSSDGYDGSYA
jgi:hypothetical protein